MAEAALAGVHGRERENGQGEKRKEGEGRGARGVQVVLQEVDPPRQVGGGIGTGQEPPRSCFQLEEEDEVHFAHLNALHLFKNF
jgi:hypothetical protein